jgi:hypothetical protein
MSDIKKTSAGLELAYAMSNHISEKCKERMREIVEKKRYRRAILIPDRVMPTIFQLECICSCHKDADGRVVYLLYDWDEQGQNVELRPGQWLCQDYDGRWEVKDKL